MLHRGASGCMRGPGYTLAGGVCTVGFNADSASADMLRWSAVQCKSATGVTQQSPALRLLYQARLNAAMHVGSWSCGLQAYMSCLLMAVRLALIGSVDQADCRCQAECYSLKAERQHT